MVDIKMEPEESEQLAPSGVPLFLKKLWKILYDEGSANVIEWNAAGDGFVILDQIQFMMELLPKYFKHNNLASFVRQLNMYGFHKRHHPEKDSENEFFNDYFIKDMPELLKYIKRKAPVHRPQKAEGASTNHLDSIFKAVKVMKVKHNMVDNELKSLKQENVALWSELNNLRGKHAKQTQIINKLIHFLVTYMHTTSNVNKRATTRLGKEGKGNSLKKRPGMFELEYKGNNRDLLKSVKKMKADSSNAKGKVDEGPTIFELEHTDCPNEYWKKFDEQMLDIHDVEDEENYGQHIVTEPEEEEVLDAALVNPNINDVTESTEELPEILNILRKDTPPVVQPTQNVVVESIPTTSQTNQPIIPEEIPTLPVITDKSQIVLDKALTSKENFNMFLNNTHSELNNTLDTLSNLNAVDIANLLELFESNVPLPMQSIEGASASADNLISNPSTSICDDGKIEINPDDMLNLETEITNIQGENNLNQNIETASLNLPVQPDEYMDIIKLLDTQQNTQ